MLNEIEKKIWLFRCVVIVFVLSCNIATGALIDSVSFLQLNLYDGGTLIMDDSSWGRVDVEVTPDATDIWYVNVVGNVGGGDAWLVENYPVFPSSYGLLNSQSVYFDIQDLGITSGDPLSGMNAVVTIEPLPQTTAPSGLTSVTVNPFNRVSSGHLGDPPAVAPTGHKASGSVSTSGNIQHKNVPAVQENINNCITGSFARSIKWLDNEYDLKNLAATKTAQQVYEDLKNLGVGHGSGKNKTEAQMLTIKANYLKTLDSRASTKFLDVSNFLPSNIPGVTEQTGDPLTWILKELKTEDVELLYDRHSITITGIYKQGGKTFLRYRDDSQQSNPLDTIGDSKTKEGELKKVGTEWQFDGSRIDYIVSESVPEPATMILLCLGGLALRKRRV